MRRIALGVLAFAGMLIAGPGCRSVRPALRPDPGATGYANIGPYVVQRFLYPAPIVERAAIEAMKDMKLNSVHRKAKDDGVEFMGYMIDGRYVCLTIEMESNNTSVVSVVFDIYGDEPLSQILIDRISIRIATLPQTLNPPFAPQALTDSVTHRGQDVAGYRGALLR